MPVTAREGGLSGDTGKDFTVSFLFVAPKLETRSEGKWPAIVPDAYPL